MIKVLFCFLVSVLLYIIGAIVSLHLILENCPEAGLKPALIFWIFLTIYILYKGDRFFDKSFEEGLLSKMNSSVDDTKRWMDAQSKRVKWKEEHPYENTSHPEYQRLLRIELGAHMLWLDSHPECLHLNKIESLSGQIEYWNV